MGADEILVEVVERPRDAYLPLPDLEVIERPGWRQLVAPSFKQGGFNEVSLSHLGADADDVIDETIARYRALGCKCVWRVGPGSAPADLADRLAARGIGRDVAIGLARSTDIQPPMLRVAQIDATNVELYTRTMAAGWNLDPAPLAIANTLAVRSPRHALFLATIDDEPVAAAGSVLFERSVYLLGGVTVAHARRRGAYRALVAARLQHARVRGIELATCHAREATSAPILESLGFERICRWDIFRG
jgi:hypothetical protein